MDIRYKSFVPRSKQDHRFDQLLQASSSVSKPSYHFSYNTSPTKADYTNFSQKSPTQMSNNRKRVNVVTFKPDESNELITHNRTNSSGSEPGTNDSPTETGGISSILRTNRLTSTKLDNTIESDVSAIDSASKLMVAKRKAAKEVADIRSNSQSSKKKCGSISSGDSIVVSNNKRAVSPEILKPEPNDNIKHHKELFPVSSRSIQNETLENDVGITQARQTFSTHQSLNISANKPTTNSKSIVSENDKIRHFNNESLRAIQKSRPIINSKKNKITYNHRPWQTSQDDDDGDSQYRLQSENIVYRSNSDSTIKSEVAQLFDFDPSDDIDCSAKNVARPKAMAKSNSDSTNNTHSRSTALIQAGNYGQKYAVIENVKEAHECQEKGETQALLDDVEYLIEGLKDNLSSSTRTLSIITLTGKCMTRSFRDLLKAHGLLAKIFRYLDDAYLSESVAMATAALFLVFSRDRQARIFDDTSLCLLLKLPRISKNQTKQSKENERIRDKIRLMLNRFHQNNTDDHTLSSEFDGNKSQSLTGSIQRPCTCCRHLKLDNNITTEDIVVECLLQFSSRKCPDWFKSLLRKQHGLDLICDQVTSSVEYMGADLGPQCLDEFVMDRLYRIFNYMRFFEHMTFQNRDNQSYLVDYGETPLVDTLLRCLKLCAANLSYQTSGSHEKKIIQACLLACLRLLANISHDNEYTSNLMGSSSGLLKLIFSCLLHLPRFMSKSKRFDLSVLALALLINLVEHCSENRRRMAHVSISRKRVACLGKCGQILDLDFITTVNNNLEKSMEFSFDDEVEDEDMDVDEDDNEDDDPDQYTNVDCESSDTKINVLEALVKLFLRHDDRAKNNTLIEGGEEETPVENTDDNDTSNNCEVAKDPKWRLVADKGVSRKNRVIKGRGHNGKDKIMDLTDSEDDGSSEEGADVEFMINSKEEEAELQKKLSAAGQHMQDSVVSAYAALLLGCIIKSSHHYMERIRQHLPLGKFKILAFVLAKFLSILSLTSGMSHTGEESILEIVRLLEAQDQLQHQVDGEVGVLSSRPVCSRVVQIGDRGESVPMESRAYGHSADDDDEGGNDDDDNDEGSRDASNESDDDDE